ncbi:unnamed protein product [Durusdinium trenchii]|uniref:EamA domain-containing protein n=1 Tax=Durusdinium trenchii TaxID=1381693 RepID=A0ABP0MFH9_9DINO
MTFPTEGRGVWAAMLCAVFTNLFLVLSKIMQGDGWPFFFVAGSAALCVAAGLVVFMICQDSYHLQRREVKWVILRGLFGCANNVLSVSAILAGAHIGSVGALLSVNTVVAALLGRLVLGEALGKLHILAVFFSLAGAILISDLDQVINLDSTAMLGNALALSAGVCLGCMFISSRKSGSASSTMLTASAMVQRWVVCWALAILPVVPDGHFELLWSSPEKTLVFLASCIFLLFVSNLAQSMAAKLCPAALSSTLITGTQMASGFLLDVFVFHKVPKALTLLGASLMFFAVITMALTRLPRRARVADPPQQVPPAEAEATVDTPKSLASFAASEYAEREVEHLSVPRQRLANLQRVFGMQTAMA